MNINGRLKIWLSPNKIHKLKLTNSFAVLLFSFFRIIFGRLSRSTKTEEFQEAFRMRFGAKRAILFPHARTALHFILKSMNLEKGSEVLMSPLNIADMVNSIHTLGLKPVFVDMELDTFCIDPEQLKKSITPNTKAILITYLFGIVPNMAKIRQLAREYGLKIIEDCSQCFDAQYNGQKIGTFGETAFFSLTNFKVCSSLFGGMVITNNEKIADRLNEFRNKDLLSPRKAMLLKLVIKDLIYLIFFSKWIFSYFTYFIVLVLENIDPRITYRLYSGNIKVLLGNQGNKLYNKFPEYYLTDYTDIQANIGLKSLSRSKHITSLRIRNGERLAGLLKNMPNIQIPVKTAGALNVHWRFPIISDDMEGLKRFLLEHGIDSAATYLTLCNSEPGFELYHKLMPNAEKIKRGVLIVEVNENLKEGDIDFTASLVQLYFRNGAKK